MARLIILVVLAATLALVFGDDEYASYVSMTGGLVPIPTVSIPWRQLSQKFVNNEHTFLDRCCLTKMYKEPLDIKNLKFNSPAIVSEIGKINGIAKKFEIAYNSGPGHYTPLQSNNDVKNLTNIARALKEINEKLPGGAKNNREGALIFAVCRDIHSIMTLIHGVHRTNSKTKDVQYALYRSKSRRIDIPKVRIPLKDISKIFDEDEHKYLMRCAVTKTGSEKGLKVEETSIHMQQILPAIARINELSKEFETAFNAGQYNYVQFDRNRISFESIAANLKYIDERLPPGHKDGHEGSLIRDMCHDMHSLMSLMIASQRDSPQMARFGYWI